VFLEWLKALSQGRFAGFLEVCSIYADFGI